MTKRRTAGLLVGLGAICLAAAAVADEPVRRPSDREVAIEYVPLGSIPPLAALRAIEAVNWNPREIKLWGKPRAIAAGPELIIGGRRIQIDRIKRVIERLKRTKSTSTEIRSNTPAKTTSPSSRRPSKWTPPAKRVSPKQGTPKRAIPKQPKGEAPKPPPKSRLAERSKSPKAGRSAEDERRVRYLEVPTGPVRIVHIEGTDLILIRGR